MCLHWKVRVFGELAVEDEKLILAYFRLAMKTTDVNWTKAKDMGDHMGYYENKQFKWFNPRNVDYKTISDKRGAPNYRD